MKIKNKFFRKITEKMPNWKYYLIIVSIAILIAMPLTVKGWINTHDGFSHLSRNYATIKSLSDGQFPALIVSSFCGGFGYSWNIFYPPLSTYISAIFKLISPTYIYAIKFTMLFAICISGITMFKFIYYIKNDEKMALVVAILYMTSNYFITDLYERLAMGEIIAYMFIPILLHGLYDIFYRNR